jgi:hypothetical protein
LLINIFNLCKNYSNQKDLHDSNDLILKKSIELPQIPPVMAEKMDMKKISVIASSFSKSLNKSVDKTLGLRSKLSRMSSRDRATINESVLSTKSVETIPENNAAEDIIVNKIKFYLLR